MSEFNIPEGACVVYWLFDERCICPWRHGYVGVTVSFKNRMNAHQANRKFPKGFKFQVLLIGSEKYCLYVESLMRPEPLIGWNVGQGGKGVPNRGRLGQKKSKEERRKISLSKVGKKFSKRHRLNLSISHIGKASHLGFKHSEKTKEQIRSKKLGMSVHTRKFRRELSKRMKGNSYTKGKPWSVARRLAWLANTPEIL